MRVHGEKVLRRRTSYPEKKLHSSYKKELQEDFQNICGYCGKDFELLVCNHQIDHLIPVEAYKQYGNIEDMNKYPNLVYSCRVCNRNKWDNWPFEDVLKQNDGTIGFVDPASEEYDKHLGRHESGKIEFNSPLGEYMFKCFKFDNRRTEVVWKLMAIKKEINKLETNIEKLDGDKRIQALENYYSLSKNFKALGIIARNEKEIL